VASPLPVAAPTRIAGRHGGEALATLRPHGARDVALGDVGDLVRQDACELRFVARREDEAVIHPDEAAGQCECVDSGIANDEEREAARAVGRLRGDARADRLQILVQLGVFQDLVLIPKLPHDHCADAVLVAAGDRRVRRRADVRKVRRSRLAREARGRGEEQGDEEG
jgi:hypothetical protein